MTEVRISSNFGRNQIKRFALPRYSPPPSPPRAGRDLRATMSTYHDGSTSSQPYKEPSSLPSSIPKVDELGTTSGPLKSAAFFIGAYCKDYNGSSFGFVGWAFGVYVGFLEDFMLCKAENRDPGHCLKEGRRVTRCAQDLCVRLEHLPLRAT